MARGNCNLVPLESKRVNDVFDGEGSGPIKSVESLLKMKFDATMHYTGDWTVTRAYKTGVLMDLYL